VPPDKKPPGKDPFTYPKTLELTVAEFTACRWSFCKLTSRMATQRWPNLSEVAQSTSFECAAWALTAMGAILESKVVSGDRELLPVR